MNYHKKKWKKHEHEAMSMKPLDNRYFSIGIDREKNIILDIIFLIK